VLLPSYVAFFAVLYQLPGGITGCELSMGLLKEEAHNFRIDRCNSFFPLHEEKKSQQ
jgi:hypothetical protein